jgi:hypothetical protein
MQACHVGDGGRSRLYFLLSVRWPTVQYIVLYITIVVFGSAYSDCTSDPQNA